MSYSENKNRRSSHSKREKTASSLPSKRQQKFARLLQRDLGDIFQEISKSHFGGAFITVTQVFPSPDMKQAKVYLSLMLTPDKAELMAQIRSHYKMIRQQLGQRLRHQVRAIPELIFYSDNTMEVVEEVNQLFKNLDIPQENKP